MRSINDEWSRVEQNPDNMLVSDSLRESINYLFNKQEDLPEAAPPLASVLKDGFRIDLELSKFEHTRDGCIIYGIASSQAGLTLISEDKLSWRGISVSTSPGADDLFNLDISTGISLTIGVEFMQSSGLCAVTITCVKVPEQRRVL